MDHGGMMGMPPPPPIMGGNETHGMGGHTMMMMTHMTFFWGHTSEILFSGWPGTSTGMYILALIFVFILSVIIEWISNSSFLKPGSIHLAAGITRTLLHAIRVGLAYIVMLALMSFNGGVFLVAVAGHSIGFLIFGSGIFFRTGSPTLPPMTC